MISQNELESSNLATTRFRKLCTCHVFVNNNELLSIHWGGGGGGLKTEFK